MQLLIILALLACSGKTNPRELIEEVKPVLETIGGEELQSALKSAEEIAEVLSAVSDIVPAAVQHEQHYEKTSAPAISFPLAPVNDIMDEDISFALNRYIKHTV